MTQFYYKPIKEKVDEIYKEHTNHSLFENGDFDLNATLIIEAETEEEAHRIRVGITDIRHWELFKTI